ncbi:cytochrome P450 [Streptomyces sp. NPDC001288]|uniref:cytochrome P450 n=1 Tax=Streptomyces sp. NPDC001297 TaxID=3364559 RepID=UPI0036C32E3F
MEQQSGRPGPPPGCPATGSTRLYGPRFGAEPDTYYEHLRDLGPSAPVDVAPGVRVELVTSYDAALYILQNPAWFVRDSRRWTAWNEGRVPADSPALPMMGYRPNALFSDGAAHARLRLAVTESLAHLDELRLAHLTQRCASYLISRLGTEQPGRAELMAEYARPLPLLVFGELFGCPPAIWDRVIAGISGIFAGTAGADQSLGEALGELISLKRSRPDTDLTSRLMQHSANLSDEEVLHQLVTLLSGGTAPSAALIGTAGALVLGEGWHTDLPVEDAVNQALWNYSPIANYAAHYPTQDVELGGRILRANDPVLISFAAANTDPRLAEHRERLSAKAHLAYGAGPHACPAKDAALTIAVTALETLLKQLPDVTTRVPFEDLDWVPTPWSRSLVALPVEFTAPAAVPSPERRETAPPDPRSPAPARPAAQQEPAAGPRPGLFSRFLAWTRRSDQGG